MLRIFRPEEKLKSQSVQLRAQVDSDIEIRTETLLGREYIVVPVIAMVEGVRFGANAEAPELGLASEFGADVITWANRPLVLNHPQMEVDGDMVYCTANTPEILDTYSFGMTMNPYVEDSKLKMEAWIDSARVNELGGEFLEVVETIQAGDMVEISVGFFSALEPKKGKFNGQAYGGVWRNIKPDHLAILSIGTLGACSNADGCGIPRINQEASMAKTAVPTIKVDKGGCGCGGHDESTCSCDAPEVLELKTHLDKEPDREELRNLIAPLISQAINGSLTDNDVRKLISAAMRKKWPNADAYLYAFTQDKAIMETYGSYNGSYGYRTFQIGINVSETGVEFVGEAEEVVLLTKIVPQAAASAESTQTNVQTKENDMADVTTTIPTTPVESKQQETVTPVAPAPVAQTTTPVAPLTAQAYIEQAPVEIREMLQSSMRLHQDRKNTLIEGIKANASNKFSEDQLKAFDLGMLENLAALASVQAPAPNYGGVAAPAQFTQPNAQAEAVPTPPKLFAVKTQA